MTRKLDLMDLVEYDARIIEQSLELNTTWVPNSSIDRNPPTKSIALPAYPPVFAERTRFSGGSSFAQWPDLVVLVVPRAQWPALHLPKPTGLTDLQGP